MAAAAATAIVLSHKVKSKIKFRTASTCKIQKKNYLEIKKENLQKCGLHKSVQYNRTTFYTAIKLKN